MSTLPNPSPDKQEGDLQPAMPPKTDPVITPDKEQRDPLPPSRPDVFPVQEPGNPVNPSETEF
jgi:hypothetical protein